jgi:hypothetical protein
MFILSLVRSRVIDELIHGAQLAFDSWKTNVFEMLLPHLENTDNIDNVQLERIWVLFAVPELPMDSDRIADMQFET